MVLWVGVEDGVVASEGLRDSMLVAVGYTVYMFVLVLDFVGVLVVGFVFIQKDLAFLLPTLRLQLICGSGVHRLPFTRVRGG